MLRNQKIIKYLLQYYTKHIVATNINSASVELFVFKSPLRPPPPPPYLSSELRLLKSTQEFMLNYLHDYSPCLLLFPSVVFIASHYIERRGRNSATVAFIEKKNMSTELPVSLDSYYGHFNSPVVKKRPGKRMR